MLTTLTTGHTYHDHLAAARPILQPDPYAPTALARAASWFRQRRAHWAPSTAPQQQQSDDPTRTWQLGNDTGQKTTPRDTLVSNCSLWTRPTCTHFGLLDSAARRPAGGEHGFYKTLSIRLKTTTTLHDNGSNNGPSMCGQHASRTGHLPQTLREYRSRLSLHVTNFTRPQIVNIPTITDLSQLINYTDVDSSWIATMALTFWAHFLQSRAGGAGAKTSIPIL